MGNLGASDIDSRLEEQLIDGILYAFQEQTQEVSAYQYLVLLQNITKTSSYRTEKLVQGANIAKFLLCS